MATTERPVESHDHDSQRLAELGCRQDLQRAWSSFSNFAMLVSAYPTAGGIYWWASELGAKGGGWFTGWSNLDEAAGVAET
jgi:hypothetical protein